MLDSVVDFFRKNLSRLSLLFFISLWFLPVNFPHAAEPGLPFTEDFSDSNLKDPLKTNATWSTDEQEVYLAWRKQLYGAMTDPDIWDIGVEADETYAIALGDVDGDGDIDIVVGNDNYGQANKLYLNNGSEIPFFLVSGKDFIIDQDYNTQAIALGDMDKDGDLDVVTGNGHQVNKLYLNNGTADPFDSINGTNIGTDTDNTQAIALGDVDGDGFLDLVAGDSGFSKLYLNNRTVNPFENVAGKNINTDSSNTFAIALGDLNGDGKLDVVIGNRYEVNKLYLNNDTSDPFNEVVGMNIGSEADPTNAIALGDMNGDGYLDVVAGNTSGTSKFYSNNGTADPFNGVNGDDIGSTNYTLSIALGDVDGDGDLDIFTGNRPQLNMLYLNNGSSTPFSGISGIAIGTDANQTRAIGLADIDGDGDLDLIEGNENQRNRLYLNNGTYDPFNGVISTDVGLETEQTPDIALGDVDGDGDLDVVVGNRMQTNKLYLNNGTENPFNGITSLDIGLDTDATYAIAIGDVDQDGDLDVVAGNYPQINKLYLNNGTGNPFNGVNSLNISMDTDSTEALSLGDLDRDGDIDVITGNAYETNKLYMNNGTANPFNGVSGAVIGLDEDYTREIALGDMDSDGDLDVVAANHQQTNRLYLNNGTLNPFNGVNALEFGSWASTTTGIGIGDVDGDGDLDVVTGNRNQLNKLYLNNGTVDPFDSVIGMDIGVDTDNTHAIDLADVDGDGDLDVMAGNNLQSNKLYLNKGTADPFNGAFSTDIGVDADSTYAIVLGDVDSDGDLDLVAGNWGQSNKLYLNSGTENQCIFCYNPGNGTIESIEVDTESLNNISNATLIFTETLSINTRVDYFLSNNGGEKFFQVYNGHEFIFPTQGNDLRWKAKLKSLSPVLTPRIQQVTITTRNIAPEANAGGTLEYTEDDPPTPIDPAITVSDIENVNFASARISISSGYQSSEDELAFTYLPDGSTTDWDAATGVLTLTGSATVADYQAALQGVTYVDLNTGHPDVGERTISFIVNDGLLDSDPVFSTVSITRTNDAPTITGHDPSPAVILQEETVTISIDDQPAPIGHIHLTVDDPDNNSNELSLIIQSGDYYSIQSNTVTPVESFFGTLIVPLLVYDGTDYGEEYDLSVQVNDITDPTVMLVTVQVDGRTVDVAFSEPMGVGVTDPSNYFISGGGQGVLSENPDEVVHFIDNTYRLTWSTGEMQDGGDVTITTTDIQDAFGRTIGLPNNGTDVGGGIGVAPVTSVINPGGTYTSSVSVTLGCTDSGSGCDQTVYSIDGGDPTTTYTAPIQIEEDTVLKFYSVDTAGNQEAEQTEIYSIEIPTTISCAVSADNITYGENFTISGTIAPPPNNPDQGVSIELIPSSGPTVFLSTDAVVNGDFSLDVNCDALPGVGEWTVRTSWPGDSSHLGATCDFDPLTVVQAISNLTLDVVMSEAVKINSRPPIGGSFSPVPHCLSMDLSNTVITLYATEPNNGPTHTLTAFANQYGQFLLDYDHAEGGGEFAFDVLGDWTIRAEYAATTNFTFAETDEVAIRVVPTAGYAIVVQGRVASGEGMPSHHKTASFVYEKLKDRQLLDDDIQYLSWLYSDGWDGDSSRTNIQNAITEWARDKMDENYHPAQGPDEAGQPGDLYIIMVDHGWTDTNDDEEGVFFIHPDDSLTSTELAGWLDELQGNLTGEAANRNIVVILGFCRAGAFVDQLLGPNRVVIASADKNESSHRGPQDVDAEGQPLRDGEYFVSEFFKSVSYGKSIKNSFEQATILTEAFTSTGSGVTNAPYYDDSVQHPLLNDNGDALGSNELSSDAGEDGAISEFLFIGASPPQGNDPGDVLVTRVAEAQFISPDPAPGIVDLWAEVDSPADVRLIWLEVKAPNYDPIDPGVGFQIEMANFKKATTDVTDTRYLWNALGNTPDPSDLFDTPGTYQIFYFVKDDVTGHTSPLMQGRVYRQIDNNNPPAAFDLLMPADCSDPGCTDELYTTVALDWEDSIDPDDHTITYTVLLSKELSANPLTLAEPIRIEGLPYSGCILGPEDGLQDNSTYHWKVIAVDEYGATQTSTSTWVFKINTTNAPAFGWIEGHVYSAYDDTPIVGATVLIDGVSLTTGTGGYYLGIFTEDTYTAEISATGFTMRTVTDISIQALGVTTREFWMGLEDQVPEPEFVTTPGTFTTVTSVELFCINQGADIRYTTDGSEPDANSLLYTNPISVTETVTIKVKAFLDAYTPSDTITGEFVIDLADGDLSGEGEVNLVDVIMGLQGIAGIEPVTDVLMSGDVNADGKVGLEEIIYILQAMAGLR